MAMEDVLMEYEMSDDIERVSWDELADVIKRAPLGTRDPSKLKLAFKNSAYRCFVYDAGKLIGAARAISDRVTYAIIFDVVVLPEYQGLRVGRSIMRFILDQALLEVAKVILYTMPGRESFYEKLGFRKMKTAMGLFPNPDLHVEYGFLS
jgi:ribosomal protein S18 acetylase RimI-like enzyme